MRALAIVLLAACGSTYQSARVLAPGKTQVTAGLTRIQPSEGGGHLNFGDLQLRHGAGGNVDVGVRLLRTPGGVQTLSAAAADVKVQVTAPDAKTTVSFALPVGILWAEGGTETDFGAFAFSPTMFIGAEVSPGVELVLSPTITLVLPDGGDDSSFNFGTGLGLRFFDDTHTWAFHPELALMRVSDGNDSATFFTAGLGISVGN